MPAAAGLSTFLRMTAGEGGWRVVVLDGDHRGGAGAPTPRGTAVACAGLIPLDVADDAQIAACMVELGKHWDGFDILVHSIGFAPREAIAGDFLDGLSREAFGQPLKTIAGKPSKRNLTF